MKREELINGRTMNAYEFYKYKTKHDLKENCGVRLTGEELFTIMNQFVAHCMLSLASHPEPYRGDARNGQSIEPSVLPSEEEMTVEEEKILILFSKYSNCLGKSPVKLPCMTRSAFVLAVREYISQKQSVVLPSVTDVGEEAHKLAEFKGFDNKPNWNTKVEVNCLRMARWFKDQIKLLNNIE